MNSLQAMQEWKNQVQDQTLSEEECEQAQAMADLELEIWWAVEQMHMQEESEAETSA